MIEGERIPINEIHAITTSRGFEVARDALLDKENGKFYEFCREYAIDPGSIRFDVSQIHVIRNRCGRPLPDIRSSQDNEDSQDFILRLVRDLARDPSTRLHCSVAGGRKTLGVLLAFALQLLGRKQDRLYHVLTHEDVECHPDFFYKPMKERFIINQSGERIDISRVHIDLPTIPFISMRELAEAVPQSESANFPRLIRTVQDAAERKIQPSKVVMITKTGDVQIDGRNLSLGRRQRDFYAYLLLRKVRCRRRRTCHNCFDCYARISKENVDEVWKDVVISLRRLFPGVHLAESAPSIEHLRSEISKINRVIDQHLRNDIFSRRYRVVAKGRRLEKVYGIEIDKSLISVT